MRMMMRMSTTAPPPIYMVILSRCAPEESNPYGLGKSQLCCRYITSALAPSEGLEPPTNWVEASDSIL